MSKKLTKVAIAYDFDGTLAPGNMQQHSFIPHLGIDSNTFWGEVKSLAKENDMNEILAYMQHMLKRAGEKRVPVTKKAFVEYGKDMPLFPGVKAFFSKINDYAKSKGLKIEHYIISSGLRDILKGTSIYREFEMVFASGYKFSENDVASGQPWQLIIPIKHSSCLGSTKALLIHGITKASTNICLTAKDICLSTG